MHKRLTHPIAKRREFLRRLAIVGITGASGYQQHCLGAHWTGL
jgi:hypothetical protein